MLTHTLTHMAKLSHWFLLVLLVLVLCSSYISAQEPEPAPEPEEEKKEKTTEIEEEKDVMVLHINNFARALSESPVLLVEFYAPWCGHCRQLEPVYAEAAGQLKGAESGVRLAKIDATEEKELAEEFDVSSFPTLRLFTQGDRKNPVNYTGKRTVTGIVQWLRRRAGPSAMVLESPASAHDLITAHNVTVVGFFTSLESTEAKAFSEVAMEMVDVMFGVTTSPEVMKKYEVKKSGVVLFKKFDEGRADLPLSENGTLDKEELTTFIQTNSLELILEFNQQTADKIFGSKVHTHSLLFINSSVESQSALLEDYRTVAQMYKGQVLFILIDVTASLSHVLKYFGLSEDDAPTVRIINTDTVKKFALGGGARGVAITVDALRGFCQGVLDGTVKPHLLSQELPEDWNLGPVSVLVAKNFDAVAFDPEKHVFVEFYAPWCGHCKELAPVWEKLGEKYAERDDIIIAKMDATANEVESVSVSGFPTLKYFPAGDDKKVVDFGGSRDLESLSKFLDNGGTLPEEDEEEEEDEDEEKVTDESSPLANGTKDEL